MDNSKESVYAIFLNEPDSVIWGLLEKEFPEGRHFILTDNLAFAAPLGITTTEQISNRLGILGGPITGIVFEFSEHSGYNRSSLWEWLRKVRA